MKYLFHFFLFILFISDTQAQYLLNFNSLSRPEKKWVLFHPFVAKKAQTLTTKALQMADTMRKDPRLDQYQNGGQIDAFRHTYWMALLAQQIHHRKVKKLGIAHEKANFIQFKKGKTEEGATPDYMSGVMDLYNNQIGVIIGQANKHASEEELRQLVFIKVKSGECKIIKRNKAGDFVTCEGKIIEMTQYKNTWEIPKCLVNSNYDVE